MKRHLPRRLFGRRNQKSYPDESTCVPTPGSSILWLAACLVSLWPTIALTQSIATLDTVCSFSNSLGRVSGLIQASDGNFYGVTASGGSNGYGSAFRVTPDGAITTLASFDLTNAFPVAPLVQGSDGYLYGTTSGAGSGGGQGTVFRMTTNGSLTTLYAFTGNDGNPQGRLVQGTNGDFYGTTSGWYNEGTVFRIGTNGALSTLVTFQSTNGAAPFAGLVEAGDGNFYGTTCLGGAAGLGTVFKMTPDGVLTTLVSFTNTGRVYSGLVQSSDGNFYGTTSGLSNSPASIYPGIVYKVTPSGEFTPLAAPFGYQTWPGTLIQASDGNLYGTTLYGGSNNAGTLFQVTPDGAFTLLLSFQCVSTGTSPSDLMQAANGLLYGATSTCGQYGHGTVFQVSIAPPPVITVRNPIMNGDEFSFQWNALTGRVYAVQWCTNLEVAPQAGTNSGPTNWYNLNSYVLATNSTMEITSPASEPRRFFRVVLKP